MRTTITILGVGIAALLLRPAVSSVGAQGPVPARAVLEAASASAARLASLEPRPTAKEAVPDPTIREDASEATSTDDPAFEVDAATRSAWSHLLALETALLAGDQGTLAAVVQELESSLEDEDVQWAYLDALRDRHSMSDQARLKLLRALFLGTGPAFQKEMREVLVQLEKESEAAFPSDPGEVVARLSDLDRYATVLQTLQRLPSERSSDPAIADALAHSVRYSEDDLRRSYAMYRLTRSGLVEATDLFLAEIEHPTSQASRLAAVRALADSGDPAGGDTLLHLLADTSELTAVRRFAASGLGDHPDLPGATHRLIDTYWNVEDTDLKIHALQSLTDHAPTVPAAREELFEILHGEGDADLRALASAGLRGIELDEAAFERILALRDSESNEHVRRLLDGLLEEVANG